MQPNLLFLYKHNHQKNSTRDIKVLLEAETYSIHKRLRMYLICIEDNLRDSTDY